MPDSRHTPAPMWLRLLGGSVLGLMAGGFIYAATIAAQRFSEIGV